MKTHIILLYKYCYKTAIELCSLLAEFMLNFTRVSAFTLTYILFLHSLCILLQNVIFLDLHITEPCLKLWNHRMTPHCRPWGKHPVGMQRQAQLPPQILLQLRSDHSEMNIMIRWTHQKHRPERAFPKYNEDCIMLIWLH